MRIVMPKWLDNAVCISGVVLVLYGCYAWRRDRNQVVWTHILSKVNNTVFVDFWTTNRTFVHGYTTNDCGYKDTYESLWIGRGWTCIETGRYW